MALCATGTSGGRQFAELVMPSIMGLIPYVRVITNPTLLAELGWFSGIQQIHFRQENQSPLKPNASFCKTPS